MIKSFVWFKNYLKIKLKKNYKQLLIIQLRYFVENKFVPTTFRAAFSKTPQPNRFQQRHAQMQQQRGAMMTAPQQQPQPQQPGFGTFNGGQQPQQQMNGQGGFDPFSMSNQQQQQQAWEAQMRAPQQGQRQGPGQAGFPANGRM